MRTLNTVLAAFLFVSVFCGSAGAVGLEISAGGWSHEPSGQIAYKSEAIGANDIDLEDEAHLDKETGVLVRAKIDMPAVFPNIYLMATPMEFEGAGSKTASFTFGDTTFSGTESFTSKLSLDHYDVGLYFGIPLLTTASLNTLNIDFGINIRMIDVYAEISQTSPVNQKDSVDETLYVPMGYLAVQINPIDELAIEAELRGIGYSDSHYYDFIGRVKYGFTGPVFVAAGYRHEEVKIDEEDIRAEIKFSGPFAEAGLEF